jgi:threonine/homoserine/homoserine lactone efflux protein
MENLLQPLITQLAIPYALILLVPGPNMLVVLRVNMNPSWARCVSIAGGIAAGAFTATTIAALSAGGLISLSSFEQSGPIVLSAILINSAIKLIRSAGRKQPTRLPGSEPASARLFSLGLATALSNPVSIPFFAGFYLTTPEARTPFGVGLGAIVIALMALLWFIAIGRMVSRPMFRSGSEKWRESLRYLLATAMVLYASHLLLRLL